MRSDVRKTFSELSTNLNANSQQLGHELKTTEGKLRNELRETSSYKASTSDLSNLGKELRDELKKTRVEFSKTVNELTINLNATSKKLETTTTNLALARSELSGTKSIIADLTTKLNAREDEIVNIRIMPTSCEDLRRMGQKINGFFLVKGSKKMETVYCDFYSNGNGTTYQVYLLLFV
ncbi:uncharacterized protein LOC124203525 [Daphnia pulex]|uniref:uncharacterized protein LOC124203525 n=1 Tax=Daphnia pulex TaxID=6669 RepID=UPI001EE152BB|nr:uncharacterized protein LOC124203525 [Daphnia pulex]